MSLPYGPIKRGMTLSWIAAHIRAELDNLTNVEGAFVFKGNPRLVALHQIDPRVALRTSEPFAVIRFGRSAPRNSSIRGVPEVIFDKGNIVHVGTGTEEVELQGNHQGNNRYVVEITESGTIGTSGSYELRKTPWAGSEWGTEVVVSSGAIPDSREIQTGDGTLAIVFAQDEGVVQGDTYTWETEAYRVTNVNGRALRQPVSVDISIMFADEASVEDSFMDQLITMFRQRQIPLEIDIADHYVIVEQELLSMDTRLFLTPKDQEAQGGAEMLISLGLEFRGLNDGKEPVMFTAEISPLIRKLDMQEPEIPED